MTKEKLQPPILLVIGGHNGSGKSTFATEYLKEFPVDFLTFHFLNLNSPKKRLFLLFLEGPDEK